MLTIEDLTAKIAILEIKLLESDQRAVLADTIARDIALAADERVSSLELQLSFQTCEGEYKQLLAAAEARCTNLESELRSQRAQVAQLRADNEHIARSAAAHVNDLMSEIITLERTKELLLKELNHQEISKLISVKLTKSESQIPLASSSPVAEDAGGVGASASSDRLSEDESKRSSRASNDRNSVT